MIPELMFLSRLFFQQSQVQTQSQISISTRTPLVSLFSSHVARRTHKWSPGCSKLCLGLFSVSRSKAADKPLKPSNWGSQTLIGKCQFAWNELTQVYTSRWISVSISSITKRQTYRTTITISLCSVNGPEWLND